MIHLIVNLSHAYHQELATPAWCAALTRFLEDRLRASGRARFEEARAIVTSRYGDDRHMGPLSLCKHWFEVTVVWMEDPLQGQADEARFEVEFEPWSGAFSSRGGVRWQIVREARATKALLAGIHDAIRRGAAHGEVAGKPCPVCSAPIRLGFSREGKMMLIACCASSDHVQIHELIPRPPAWWREHATE